MSTQLTMVRGTVTAAREQMHSVRVDRRSGFGRINSTPELWLRDTDGREYRYQGVIFAAAQPGHEVAVVSRPSSGKPLAFANFTTGVVHDSKELTISTSSGSTLISTLVFSLLLALPGALMWAVLLDIIGLGDQAFSGIGVQAYVIVLVASVYAGLRVWSKAYRARVSTLRSEIDQLLASDTTQKAI